MKKYVKTLIVTALSLMVVFGIQKETAYAMEDGAYLVPVTYSYVNPETNQTVDGSTNIALGESMIGSMLEKNALVEQVNGKTYVTIGIGLMSNVSNVRITVQNGKGGSYSQASITKTGSSSMNGDTCNHYRFQVKATNAYISPIIYVDPMGRDVQFFIGLSMGSATKGTGIYKSEMVKVQATATPAPTAKPTATPAATKKPSATATPKPEATVTATPEVNKEETETQITEDPEATEEPTEEPVVEVGEEVHDEKSPQEKEEEQAEATPEVIEVVAEEEIVVDHSKDPLYIGIIIVSVIGSAILLWIGKKGGHHE